MSTETDTSEADREVNDPTDRTAAVAPAQEVSMPPDAAGAAPRTMPAANDAAAGADAVLSSEELEAMHAFSVAECKACEGDELAKHLLNGLGYCGRFLHFHGGGLSGKAPLLCFIAHHGGQTSQQELGCSFDLKPGSLSEILTKIESAGLIERTRNPEDRRQLSIRLTLAGWREATREQERRVEFRRRAFDSLTEEERRTLDILLSKIRTRWEELND